MQLTEKQRKLIEGELDTCGEILHNVWIEKRKAQGYHRFKDCPDFPGNIDTSMGCSQCNEYMEPYSELTTPEKQLNQEGMRKALEYLAEKGIIHVGRDE